MTQEQKQTAGTVSHILRFLADCVDSLSGEGKYPPDFAKLHLLTHRDNYHHALVIGRGQIDELLEDGQ